MLIKIHLLMRNGRQKLYSTILFESETNSNAQRVQNLWINFIDCCCCCFVIFIYFYHRNKGPMQKSFHQKFATDRLSSHERSHHMKFGYIHLSPFSARRWNDMKWNEIELDPSKYCTKDKEANEWNLWEWQCEFEREALDFT